MKTAKTKIDVYTGTLSMEFGDNKVHFKLCDAMTYPPEEHSIFHLASPNSLVDDVHANLLAEFPEIVGIRDDFECPDCYEIHDLCTVSAEITAYLHGDNFACSISVCVDSNDSFNFDHSANSNYADSIP